MTFSVILCTTALFYLFRKNDLVKSDVKPNPTVFIYKKNYPYILLYVIKGNKIKLTTFNSDVHTHYEYILLRRFNFLDVPKKTAFESKLPLRTWCKMIDGTKE